MATGVVVAGGTGGCRNEQPPTKPVAAGLASRNSPVSVYILTADTT